METCIIKFRLTCYDLHADLRYAIDKFKEMYTRDKYFWKPSTLSIENPENTTYWFMKVVDWYVSHIQIAEQAKSNIVRCIYLIELFEFIQEHLPFIKHLGIITEKFIKIANKEIHNEKNTQDHKKFFEHFISSAK